MKIETKFDIGQTVYFIEEKTALTPTSEPCDVCNETGRVTIKNMEYMCPKCGGRLMTFEELKVQCVASDIIENITIAAFGYFYDLAEHATVYNETKIYATLEEVNDAYDKQFGGMAPDPVGNPGVRGNIENVVTQDADVNSEADDDKLIADELISSYTKKKPRKTDEAEDIVG